MSLKDSIQVSSNPEKRYLKYLISYLFLIICFWVKGQELSYTLWNTDNGLPSSIVNDIAQDNMGYIWFATDLGLCRFNGTEFTVFRKQDGLPENSISKILHQNDKLLFITHTGWLFNMVDDNARLKFSWNSLKAALADETIDNAVIDDKGILWITSLSGKIIGLELKSGKLMTLNESEFDFSGTIWLKNTANSFLWASLQNQVSSPFVSVSVKNDVFIVTQNTQAEYPSKYLLHKGNDSILLAFENSLFIIIKGKVTGVQKFDFPIKYLAADDAGNLFVGTSKGGCYMFPSGNLDAKAQHYFMNKSISKVIRDREDGYWFIFENEGVAYVPSLSFLVYPELTFQVFSLDRSGNDIYFSTYDNKLYTCTINGENIRNLRTVNVPYRNGNIEDIYCARDGSFWILWSAKNLKKHHIFRPLDLMAVQYKIVKNGKKSAVRLLKTDSLIFHETQDLIFSSFETFREKYFVLSPDPSGKVCLGRYEGLLETENGIIKFRNQKGKLILDRITDIKTSEKLLFAGTRNNGLQVIDVAGNAFSITNEQGLSSNLIKCILIDRDSTIWVGTDQGLNHIYYSALKGTLSHISSFNIRDGLLSNQINDLVEWNNLILAATKNGIMIFDPQSASKSAVLPVTGLKSVVINDDMTLKQMPQKLKHNQNTIVLYFDGISIRNPEKLYFRYMLEGVDKDWMNTREAMVRYPKLESGKYTFLLKSGLMHENAETTAMKYSFEIKRHFSQTLPFIALVVLAGISLSFLIYTRILSARRKKEEMERKKLTAELATLRSQMNPHFIFNALYAIRDLVMKKDELLLDQYISNFGQLTRKILHNSVKETITLQEELEIVQHYLEVEYQRCDNKFSYKIDIAQNVYPAELYIPPMIIQPYLENAIWHGLANKPGTGGLIWLSVNWINHKLCITIEDNGIGRKESMLINEKKKRDRTHKSVAQINIAERIKLFNELYNSTITSEIMDLGENGVALGTRVVIYIPENTFGNKYPDEI